MMMFYFGLVVLFVLAISDVESNLEVTTSLNATAYRGGNITLPCRFTGEVTAVWWYKHNRTGAPDDQSKIVVQNFNGKVIQSDDKRYSITPDYSMVISNVAVGDETTYSCSVALDDGSTGRNYTHLTVIALARPLHPVVRKCIETEPGKCDYEVGEVISENFFLTCRVDQVRPAVSLSWTTQGGEERTPSEPSPDPDENGLFNVKSTLTASKTEIGEAFVCKAVGESVNGTSALVVTVKYPPNEGLSTGAKAGISLVVIILLAAILVGIGVAYFLWMRKKKQRKPGPEDEPLSPKQQELNELAEKLQNYRPGSFSKLEEREGRNLPKVTRLGVFGVTHAGKSSLVRSLKYSLTGEFIGVEVAQSHSIGGVTIVPKSFAITKHISVVDNRGLKDLDVACINDILDQIRGKHKHLDGTVDFPILVFDARQPINALDKFLPDFVKAIRNEFGSHPAIVFTHRSGLGDRMDTIKAQATGMGALDQKLHFIENFTVKPTVPCPEHRLEFLTMLTGMLECADENLIQRDNNKKSGGNGATSVVQMGVVEPGNTSGSKSFLGFFKKK